MMFFEDNYELDERLIEDGLPDPIVQKMEDEIRDLLEKNGIEVLSIDSEYELSIESIDVKLNDMMLRFTGDDEGVPCIDILVPNENNYYGKIISTHYVKNTNDLISFVEKIK